LENKNNIEKKDKIYLNKIRNLVNKTLYEFDLLKENDRILVGLSGGKDSLTLLECLALRKLHGDINFDLAAVYVKVENSSYQIDEPQIKNICDQLKVPLIFHELILDDKKTSRTRCFICSWNRRKVLFEIAKQHDFNKLALGHHMDDALETMMLNMIYHGSLSSLPGKLKMFKGRMELIRPLLLLTNAEIKKYAEIRDFPKLKSNCPFENYTQRNEMRNLVNELSLLNPAARINMFNAMTKIFHEYLPEKGRK